MEAVVCAIAVAPKKSQMLRRKEENLSSRVHALGDANGDLLANAPLVRQSWEKFGQNVPCVSHHGHVVIGLGIFTRGVFYESAMTPFTREELCLWEWLRRRRDVFTLRARTCIPLSKPQ